MDDDEEESEMPRKKKKAAASKKKTKSKKKVSSKKGRKGVAAKEAAPTEDTEEWQVCPDCEAKCPAKAIGCHACGSKWEDPEEEEIKSSIEGTELPEEPAFVEVKLSLSVPLYEVVEKQASAEGTCLEKVLERALELGAIQIRDQSIPTDMPEKENVVDYDDGEDQEFLDAFEHAARVA